MKCFVLITFACLANACSSPPVADSVQLEATQAASPLVVTIEGVDHAIDVTGTPAGTRYSISTSDGTLVVAHASLQELRDQHPKFATLIETATADWAGLNVDNSLPTAGEGHRHLDFVMPAFSPMIEPAILDLPSPQ